MLGLVAAAMVVAPMVAPVIGGILDTAFGWEAIFVFIAAVSLVVVVWAAAGLPETRRRSPDPGEQIKLFAEMRKLSTSRVFAGYVLAGALGSGPFFTFLGGGPHVVVTIMGRSSAEYGAWLAVNTIGFMIGNLSASRFSMRYGVDALIRCGLAIVVVGTIVSVLCAVLIPDHGPAIVFLPQLITSLGNGMLLPSTIAGAVSVRPQAAGAASGISGFIQMAVGAAAAQAVGHLLAGASTPLPMALTMLAFALAAGLTFWLFMRGDPQRQTNAA
jgi:DHA1 family bicyclomycin/chloramphenicol resistance-like MFS transporter